MTPITGGFFLLVIVITVPNASADQSIFEPRRPHFPRDPWIGAAVFSPHCNDPVACNSVTLKINRTDNRIAGSPVDHLHEIHLIKKFELILNRETCSHYISPHKHDFAAVRICEPKEPNKYTKEYTGTFFDADHARYDIMRKPGHDVHSITRVVLNKTKDLVEKGRLRDSRSVAIERAMLEFGNRAMEARAASGESTQKPIFGTFRKPTIELLITVDQKVVNYFEGNMNPMIPYTGVKAETEDVIIKYIGMLATTADALFSRMNVSLKLIGVRFLPKYKFTPRRPRDFAEYSFQLMKFIVSDVTNYYGNVSVNRVKGLPDATVTLTHAFPRDEDMGIAGPRNPELGGFALVKCSHDAFITSELDRPHRLHHFVNGHTIAHEIGHILQFKHPEHSVTECYTIHGNCIMADTDFWSLPFWLQNETAFIRDSLTGSHAYLLQQNAMHPDKPSVRLMSHSFRMLLWFLCAASMIICVFIAYQFYSWRKMQPSAAKYQQLSETESGRKRD